MDTGTNSSSTFSEKGYQGNYKVMKCILGCLRQCIWHVMLCMHSTLISLKKSTIVGSSTVFCQPFWGTSNLKIKSFHHPLFSYFFLQCNYIHTTYFFYFLERTVWIPQCVLLKRDRNLAKTSQHCLDFIFESLEISQSYSTFK